MFRSCNFPKIDPVNTPHPLRHVLAAVLVLLALAVSTARLQAQGAPPMLTDDPDTPGNHHWEINIFGTFEHSPSSQTSEAPTFDFNYGLGDRLQLTYEISYLEKRDNGEPSQSGLSDSTVGVKYRFYDAGEDGTKISAYPQVNFENPGSSTVAKGLEDKGTSLILPMELETTLGPVILTTEAGHVVHTADKDSWFWGLNFGHEFTKKLNIGFEAYTIFNERFSRSELIGDVGGHYDIDEHNTFFILVGKDLHNQIDERVHFIGIVGWQFNL